MDPEIKFLVEETHKLTQENHKLLKAVRRSQWVTTISTIIIWVVVLALPVFLWQEYIAPTIEKFSALSKESTTTTSQLFGIPTSGEVQKLLNSIKSGSSSPE